ncbi:MAG TPA: HEAT repeat domain-containing protein [Pyrinomonadaceae bacterium]|nr:HEAT repeat domain-containing protein [Pyrinomonadaceae bacterium]
MNAREGRAFAPSLRVAVLRSALCALLLLGLNAGTIQVSASAAASTSAQRRQKGRDVATASSARLYFEGRDLIERGDWARAAEIFERFVAAHPGDENADAALYWLAYALKKQAKYAEAGQRLERLLRDSPESPWADDARAMRVELAPFSGNVRLVEEALAGGDEALKLVALQSLFQTEPERAARYAAEIVAPDSRLSAQQKQAVLALLGRVGGKQSVALLMSVAKGQADAKLRRTALVSLGQIGDESALDFLKEEANDPSPDISEAALYAIARQEAGGRGTSVLGDVARVGASLDVRRAAIRWLGRKGGEAAAEELVKVHDVESDAAVRREVLLALSQIESPRAQSKLLEVAREPGDKDLRKQAIFWLGRSRDEAVVGHLSDLYDETADPDIKERILFVLAQSAHTRAARKLMDVARGDASAEMRKRALFWLAQSADPSVKEFLKGMKVDGN